jgi:hypothetical protein
MARMWWLISPLEVGQWALRTFKAILDVWPWYLSTGLTYSGPPLLLQRLLGVETSDGAYLTAQLDHCRRFVLTDSKKSPTSVSYWFLSLVRI